MKSVLFTVIIMMFSLFARSMSDSTSQKQLFLKHLKIVKAYKQGHKSNIEEVYDAVFFLGTMCRIIPHVDINHTNPYPDKKMLEMDYKAWKKWFRRNKKNI